MICNIPLLFSHSKNIPLSILITITITYYLLIIIIITKNRNNYFSAGVMELCLLNLLILIDCFLCNSYPCVFFESLSHVINQESHVYLSNLGEIYLAHFLKFWNQHFFDFWFQNFKKVNSVNLSQISVLNMWLLGLILGHWRKIKSSFEYLSINIYFTQNHFSCYISLHLKCKQSKWQIRKTNFTVLRAVVKTCSIKKVF